MKQIVIAVFIVFSLNAWSGDAERGKTISTTCAACHGVDGNSAVNPLWPKIAGQHAQYIERQLQLYKSGARENVNMTAMVVGLSDQDMADLAAYYASQTTALAAADPELVELGESIYTAGIKDRNIPACMACHGPTGQGNPLSGYPVLAGQHAPYTAQRLEAYRAGEVIEDANNVNGKIMADIAKYMSDEEIQSVSSYLQGLRAAQ